MITYAHTNNILAHTHTHTHTALTKNTQTQSHTCTHLHTQAEPEGSLAKESVNVSGARVVTWTGGITKYCEAEPSDTIHGLFTTLKWVIGMF